MIIISTWLINSQNGIKSIKDKYVKDLKVNKTKKLINLYNYSKDLLV